MKIKKLALAFIFIVFQGDISLKATELQFYGINSDEKKWKPATVTDQSWHSAQTSSIQAVHNQIIGLNYGSHNVAVFRLKVVNSENNAEVIKDFKNTFFISGGNQRLMTQLEEQGIEGSDPPAQFKCVSHYCPSVPGKPQDFGLRDNILNFFGFKERLTSNDKNSLRESFVQSVKYMDTDEVTFKPKMLKMLGDVYESTLHARLLDDESDQMAKTTLGLIDKQNKDNPLTHIDTLFNTSFQLQFADSEQAIRLFVSEEASEKECKWWKLTSDSLLITDLLKALPEDKCKEFQDKLEKYKKLLTRINKLNNDSKNKTGKENEINAIKKELGKKEGELDAIKKELRDISENNNKEISKFLQKLQIHLEIASYNDMCKNCQATFQHDITTRHLLQKNFLTLLFRSLEGEALQLKYLKRIFFEDTKKDVSESLFLKNSIVSITVSGVNRY